MKCPYCNAKNSESATYCWLCYKVFPKKDSSDPISKVQQTKTCVSSQQDIPTTTLPKNQDLISGQSSATNTSFIIHWKIFVMGFVVSVVFHNIPVLRMGFRFISTFFHECGHVLVGLFFGYISVPGVNPFDTGGVTLILAHFKFFPYIILFFLIGVVFYFRNYKEIVLGGVAAIILYSIFAFTYLHDWLILVAGHLAVIAAAGVSMYLALFNQNFKSEKRWVCSLIGWMLWIEEVVFLFKLKNDVAFRETYMLIEGKGWQDGLLNDLIKLAYEVNYKFTVNSFDTIINLFIIVVFIPITIIVITAIKKRNIIRLSNS